jgi:hypothetical protein
MTWQKAGRYTVWGLMLVGLASRTVIYIAV